MNEILNLTIAEARRLLVARDLSCVELAEATIRHIERTDACLHAYATVTAEQALESARSADVEIGRGVSRGPLHGIPVGVKDLCHMRGVPTEAGSEVLKGYIPDVDSTVVERLRAGGAVIVGKTVTSEFAFGPTLRPTRNAWDQDRNPEGSSAGSAVAVAARSAFATIGTDTAGSIRAPAGVNGVVGLKPTFGLVGTSGLIPMSPSLDHIGPITRTVEDCAAVLSVIAGFDPRDPHGLEVEPPAFPLDPPRGLEGVRIGIESTYLPPPGLDPIARDAALCAASALRELGATIVEVEIPELELTEASIVTIKAVEASAYHLSRLRRDASAFHRTTRVILQAGALIPAVQYAEAERARALITRSVRETFQRHDLDALLGPGWGPATAVTAPADVLHADGVPFTFPMRPNAVNLTGMPAINVPCGYTESGLPLGGFELWGRPLGEPTLLHIAAAYEAVNPWHLRTPAIAQKSTHEVA
ncbi:amidase [Streptomyces sp. NPDC001393]